MTYDFHGLKFRWLEQAPKTPGLYTIGRGKTVLYVGESQNRFNRMDDYSRGGHAGLARAIHMSAEWVHFSDEVWGQQDRWDIETLMRREYNPPANQEPYPSAKSCSAAARRIGLQSLACNYDLLSNPLPQLPKRMNAFAAVPTGLHHQQRNPFI